MTERVQTGGTMSFEYKKGQASRLGAEQKREIEEAYEKYYERRRREKNKKKIIFVAAAILIFLLILAAIFFLK